jgi:hypothetical protein
VAGCCECGDEPSGSCATELVEVQRMHFLIEILMRYVCSVQIHFVRCRRTVLSPKTD